MTRLLSAVLVLLVLDVVGAAWAVTSGVNSPADALGSSARLAAPWPMILFQVVMSLTAWRAAGWRATIACGLLAIACLVSAISGFFDGGLGAPGLSRAQVVFQYVLVTWTAVVGALALVRLRELRESVRR